MSKNSIFKKFKSEKAFTLIELLVVVAIIGILSGVVLASLNSAREKGKIASIKSTLKQLYNQASLNQLEYGNFTNTTTGNGNTNLDCIGPDNNLAKIVQPLIDKGVYVKCQSLNGTLYINEGGDAYMGDNFLRFGATALLYDNGELKAWSVDENGVVKWDTQGVDSSGAFVTPDIKANWANAKNYCALSGGRLPSMEQVITLSHTWYAATFASLGTGSYTPTPTNGGFQESNYWSSTLVPSSPSTMAYSPYIPVAFIGSPQLTVSVYFRCVR